jgi:hypothetical protein
VALGWIATQIAEFAKADPGDGRLAAERELLAKALDDVQGIVGWMIGTLMKTDPRSEGGDPRNIYKVGQNTTRLLMAAGDLVIGWLLLRGADVATSALAAGGDALPAKEKAFYEGKIAAARFFVTQVLPRLAADRLIVESTDNALMEVDESAF